MPLINFVCTPQDPPIIITVVDISTNIDDVNGPSIEERYRPSKKITKMDTIPMATVVRIQIFLFAGTMLDEDIVSFLPGLFHDIVDIRILKSFPLYESRVSRTRSPVNGQSSGCNHNTIFVSVCHITTCF